MLKQIVKVNLLHQRMLMQTHFIDTIQKEMHMWIFLTISNKKMNHKINNKMFLLLFGCGITCQSINIVRHRVFFGGGQ